jgi:hypothetical protein
MATIRSGNSVCHVCMISGFPLLFHGGEFLTFVNGSLRSVRIIMWYNLVVVLVVIDSMLWQRAGPEQMCSHLICEDAHNLRRKVGVMCWSETSGFDIGQRQPSGFVEAVPAFRTPSSRGSKSRAENGLREGRVWCRRTTVQWMTDEAQEPSSYTTFWFLNPMALNSAHACSARLRDKMRPIWAVCWFVSREQRKSPVSPRS